MNDCSKFCPVQKGCCRLSNERQLLAVVATLKLGATLQLLNRLGTKSLKLIKSFRSFESPAAIAPLDDSLRVVYRRSAPILRQKPRLDLSCSLPGCGSCLPCNPPFSVLHVRVLRASGVDGISCCFSKGRPTTFAHRTIAAPIGLSGRWLPFESEQIAPAAVCFGSAPG